MIRTNADIPMASFSFKILILVITNSSDVAFTILVFFPYWSAHAQQVSFATLIAVAIRCANTNAVSWFFPLIDEGETMVRRMDAVIIIAVRVVNGPGAARDRFYFRSSKVTKQIARAFIIMVTIAFARTDSGISAR